MKYVSISQSDTLKDLTERVGVQNVDQILADNGLDRVPKIGKVWYNKCQQIEQTAEDVSAIRKLAILNQFVDNYDVYQTAALANESTWKVLASTNSFPNYLYVSTQLEDYVPDSYLVLGNHESVPNLIYDKVTNSLKNDLTVDADIFATYSTINHTGLLADATSANKSDNPMSWFNLPLDEVTLYSSLSDASMSIPAYPEEISDGRNATYVQMPDLIYQYEPWQMYNSSGPRSLTIDFHLHRDMWTGDHTDGKANELIRFCEAQCYPKYNGSAVNSATTSLYIHGKNFITGIVTAVNTTWSGPIGLDGWYLEFKLSISFTEVSKTALDYNAILEKDLIG